MGVKIGIIGGTGLNNPDILKNTIKREVMTPFGKPSDVIVEGDIEGVSCVLLARHGRCHSIPPHHINFRANIWALKEAGCTHIIGSNACGGLQEWTKPGDILVLDQFFDYTSGRAATIFDGKIGSPEGVYHIPMSEPFCTKTRNMLIAAGRKVLSNVCEAPEHRSKLGDPCLHTSGSCIVVNGPRFSTRLESSIFHSWNIDTINMTLAPEVGLAREAGICYASLAMVTDYDSWKDETPAVSVTNVLSVFHKNVDTVKSIIIEAIKLISRNDWSDVIRANKELIDSAMQSTVVRYMM